MKKKPMEQVGETFLDYFKKNKGVYSHNDVEKIVDQAILNEKERIVEFVKKEVLITNGYGYIDEYADKEDVIKLELIEWQKEQLEKLTKESKT